ncbi:MAG: TrmH family RNA methyltransferase [Solirubrobacteraceae bacterium]
MPTITSTDNQQLKLIRRLARRQARARENLFVAEGEDLVSAAHAAGRPARALLWAAPAPREDCIEVDPALLAAVSTLGSGTRAIGVYEQRWAVRPKGPLCVYLHGVRDPGNVGTIIRSAQAFGASCVAFGPDCADPHGPKAVRASMGAIFAATLARAPSLDALPGERVGLHAAAQEHLHGPASRPTTLLVGAEREGLPVELLASCARVCSIPQAAGDSLNAAMAATIALYEMARVEIA